MTASVEIMTNQKTDVLSVPLAAVTTRNPEMNEQGSQGNKKEVSNDSKPVTEKKKEEKVVVFINENGTAKMVEVKTGISDYDNIEITEGLKDTVQIVTGPFLVVSKRLKDGDKIRKAEEKKSN